MKLTNINEARKYKKPHIASIAGREYTDVTFKEAKRIATKLGANLLWWDDVPYKFDHGVWEHK